MKNQRKSGNSLNSKYKTVSMPMISNMSNFPYE